MLVPGVWRLVRILCPCDPRKRVMTPQSLMRDPSLCDRCKRGTELRRLMRILRLCHRRKRLPGLWRLMRIPRLCHRRKRVMGPSLLMRTPRLCDLPTRPLQRRRATHPLPSCLNPHACRSQRLTWCHSTLTQHHRFAAGRSAPPHPNRHSTHSVQQCHPQHNSSPRRQTRGVAVRPGTPRLSAQVGRVQGGTPGVRGSGQLWRRPPRPISRQRTRRGRQRIRRGLRCWPRCVRFSRRRTPWVDWSTSAQPVVGVPGWSRCPALHTSRTTGLSAVSACLLVLMRP